MNLPNKITVFRILLIPVIIVISLIDSWQTKTLIFDITLTNFLMLILFIIGAISDFFDGHIARKRGLITSFGKFMDPLADKLLVFTLFIILLEQGSLLQGWVVIIILAREFMVSGLRMLAATHQKVISAGWLGKIKTNFQFLLVILLLLVPNPTNSVLNIIWYIIMYGTALITIISGLEYVSKNKEIILESK